MFYVARCGICRVLIIFERQRSRLGSKISGYGQLAVVAVDLANSTPRKQTSIGRVGLSPEDQSSGRVRRNSPSGRHPTSPQIAKGPARHKMKRYSSPSRLNRLPFLIRLQPLHLKEDPRLSPREHRTPFTRIGEPRQAAMRLTLECSKRRLRGLLGRGTGRFPIFPIESRS
jgi:hypothetical protein